MNATTPTPADTAKTIKALRKRLERWELEHLRQLAASLADRLEAAGATVGLTQGGTLVVCGDAQPTTPTQSTGDAWRYCSNLGSPEAARALVQATLTASGTIRFALTQTGDAASFATVPDWQAVQRELLHALHVAGHPAGRA